MFMFDGKQTLAAVATNAVLRNCGLPVSDPSREDSFALVVYRQDPRDQQFYLSGHAGLRSPEPMYGPSNYSDFRSTLDYATASTNPFGFRSRENTVWVEAVQRSSWQLHVNGRAGADRTAFEKVQRELVGALSEILEVSADATAPLYPDLWYHELLARDRLRDRFQALPPGTPLEEVAQHLCQGLHEVLLQLMPGASANVGLYFDTGEDWALCSRPMPPWLPASVKRQGDEELPDPAVLNALDWASGSTRSLSLTRPLSRYWRTAVERCGPDFVQAVNHPHFSGLAVVPVLYPSAQWRCMGILLASVLNAPILPAHIFLLNRLAIGVAGYLMPLMPIPGFPWWPKARLRRGGASVTWEHGKQPVAESAMPIEVIERAISDLMPGSSKVLATPLRSGHSGTEVVRLTIADEGKIPEVPRILKIGDPRVIATELKGYYRYVHNKKIGGASRVDIARGFWAPDLTNIEAWRPRGRDFGAIVYTLVGAGDLALPWTQWAKVASQDELRRGFDLLLDQLIDWYHRSSPEQRSATDLLIRPLAEGRMVNYLDDETRDPSFGEVVDVLRAISTVASGGPSASKSCIVHGDLHGDNVFAVLSQQGIVKSVALIDWGNVRSGYHPLSDISKLAIDLEFRVGVDDVMKSISREAVRDWGKLLGCDENDWKLATINQLARVLFYRSGVWTRPARPHSLLSQEARIEAWQRLQDLAGEIINAAKQPPLRLARGR